MGILGGLGRPPLSKKFPKLFLRCVQILAGCSGVFFCLSLVERPSFIFPLIQERSLPTSRSSVIDFPSWEYYAKAFQSRDIFSSVHKPDAMAVTGIPAFRVKGLMFGLRRSVVLEDLHAGRTLFLTEGEKQEQIFVKKIKALWRAKINRVAPLIYACCFGDSHKKFVIDCVCLK